LSGPQTVVDTIVEVLVAQREIEHWSEEQIDALLSLSGAASPSTPTPSRWAAVAKPAWAMCATRR
jgi:hypothetical protein